MNEYDEDTSDGTDLVKDLRRQLKEQSSKLKEYETELSDIRSEKRTTSVSAKLAEAGYPSEVAKFVPTDLELDEMDHWLEENGSLFSKSAEVAAATEAEKPRPDVVAESKRVSSMSEEAIPLDKMNDLQSRLATANSDEEIQNILNEAKRFVL